jgi:ABC-type sugar transport system permease subunit
MSYGYPAPQGYSDYSGYGTPYPVRRSAPASIHVVAIIQYIGGFLALLGAGLLALVAFGGASRYRDQLDQYGELNRAGLNTVATAFGVMAGLIAIVGLIAIWLGRKVQRGRNWARIILIILNVLSLAGTAYSMYQSRAVDVSLGGVIIPILCLILLNTRAARSWCHYHTY